MGSYTARELERDTGFGGRTIAYYIQEGLLPRVGRRGPRTRYPEPVRERLLFIRCVREAEAEGEIPPVSLKELRQLFEVLPRALVAGVAAGETPLTSDIVALPPAKRRSRTDRFAALMERRLYEDRRSRPARRRDALSRYDGVVHMEMAAMDPPRGRRARGEEDDGFENRLRWVLNGLRDLARRRRAGARDAAEMWSQFEVTPDVRLSIRGTEEEDERLLQTAGRLLRQALEPGGPLADEPPGGARKRRRAGKGSRPVGRGSGPRSGRDRS